MVQPTINELSLRLNTWANWRLHHGDTILRLKVYITDAKVAYGSVRYLCEIEKQYIWLDETSIEWEAD